MYTAGRLKGRRMLFKCYCNFDMRVIQNQLFQSTVMYVFDNVDSSVRPLIFLET